jgi:hypothetical protein
MESITRWILQLINSERHGGRVMCTDEHTAILYDCGMWSDAHTQLIHAKYPECEVTILPSEASLSGFIVVFKMHRDRSVYTWVTAAVLAMSLILLTGRQMIGE